MLDKYSKGKTDRVFFTGSLFNHVDDQYGVRRNRNHMHSQIKDTLYNPGHLSHSQFLNEMENSKFSLDLLGVGDPNMRTFEIILSGSLMISEKNNLTWPFPEKFISFEDGKDYTKVLQKLRCDDKLYNKFLQKQFQIANKYFNIIWIKKYLLKQIKEYKY